MITSNNNKSLRVKNSFFIIQISVISVLIWGCNKENAWDCVQTTGDIIAQTREISNFNKIQLEDNINLIISQDSTINLSVVGGENLLPDVVTEVKGDTLIIKNDNKCNFVRSFDTPINVCVSVKSLRNMYLYGYGSISTIDTLVEDSFRIDGWNASSKINLMLHVKDANFHLTTGPMELNVSGIANSCYIYSSGFAIADIRNLHSKNTGVNNSGIGDFYVFASNYLNAEIKSYGNVYFTGSPTQIVSFTNSSGKLIKLD